MTSPPGFHPRVPGKSPAPLFSALSLTVSKLPAFRRRSSYRRRAFNTHRPGYSPYTGESRKTDPKRISGRSIYSRGFRWTDRGKYVPSRRATWPPRKAPTCHATCSSPRWPCCSRRCPRLFIDALWDTGGRLNEILPLTREDFALNDPLTGAPL